MPSCRALTVRQLPDLALIRSTVDFSRCASRYAIWRASASACTSSRRTLCRLTRPRLNSAIPTPEDWEECGVLWWHVPLKLERDHWWQRATDIDRCRVYVKEVATGKCDVARVQSEAGP